MTRLVAIVALALAPFASAQDLFVFMLTEDGNPANQLTVSGSSIPNLADDFGNLEGQFQSFDGLPVSATVQYAGVSDAIAISLDPTGGANGGRLLTITNLLGSGAIPAFDEANGGLGEQLRDFFLQDNPEALSDFLEAINQQSLVAVTDGNPLAMTARSARYKYDWFGLNANHALTKHDVYRDFQLRNYQRQLEDAGESQTDEDGQPTITPPPLPSEQKKGWARTRFHLSGSVIDAGDFNGWAADFWLGTEFVISPHFSLHLGGAFGYQNIEEADVFKGGLHIDAPIRIIIPEPGAKVGWTWQVTPGAALESTGSLEYAAGGLMTSGGVVNRITADLPLGWSLTAAQSITFHQGQQIEIGDYSFDPGVEQQILKIGGKVDKRIGQNSFVYAGITWSDFLQEAAVDDFWSPLAGLGFYWANGSTLTIAYEGDYADDFTRHALRADYRLPF